MGPLASRGLRLGILLGLLAALAGVYLGFLRPWHARWGSTDQEVERVLPGDELWPAPARVETRALTISAPPEEVWGWVRQLGRDRGGFYAYPWLVNLAGARLEDADRLLPDLPERAPGEKLWLAAPETLGGILFMVVARVEPRRALVALTHVRADEAPGGTWALVLERLGPSSTRLLVRTRSGRASAAVPLGRRLFDLFLLEPAHFVLERRTMLGIAERAERRLPPAWWNVAEVIGWMAALVAFLASIVSALWRRPSPRPFLLFAASGAALLLLPMLRPPLAVELALAALLVAAVPWSFQGRRRAGGLTFGHVRMPR